MRYKASHAVPSNSDVHIELESCDLIILPEASLTNHEKTTTLHNGNSARLNGTAELNPIEDTSATIWVDIEGIRFPRSIAHFPYFFHWRRSTTTLLTPSELSIKNTDTISGVDSLRKAPDAAPNAAPNAEANGVTDGAATQKYAFSSRRLLEESAWSQCRVTVRLGASSIFRNLKLSSRTDSHLGATIRQSRTPPKIRATESLEISLFNTFAELRNFETGKLTVLGHSARADLMILPNSIVPNVQLDLNSSSVTVVSHRPLEVQMPLNLAPLSLLQCDGFDLQVIISSDEKVLSFLGPSSYFPPGHDTALTLQGHRTTAQFMVTGLAEASHTFSHGQSHHHIPRASLPSDSRSVTGANRPRDLLQQRTLKTWAGQDQSSTTLAPEYTHALSSAAAWVESMGDQDWWLEVDSPMGTWLFISGETAVRPSLLNRVLSADLFTPASHRVFVDVSGKYCLGKPHSQNGYLPSHWPRRSRTVRDEGSEHSELTVDAHLLSPKARLRRLGRHRPSSLQPPLCAPFLLRQLLALLRRELPFLAQSTARAYFRPRPHFLNQNLAVLAAATPPTLPLPVHSSPATMAPAAEASGWRRWVDWPPGWSLPQALRSKKTIESSSATLKASSKRLPVPHFQMHELEEEVADLRVYEVDLKSGRMFRIDDSVERGSAEGSHLAAVEKAEKRMRNCFLLGSVLLSLICLTMYRRAKGYLNGKLVGEHLNSFKSRNDNTHRLQLNERSVRTQVMATVTTRADCDVNALVVQWRESFQRMQQHTIHIEIQSLHDTGSHTQSSSHPASSSHFSPFSPFSRQSHEHGRRMPSHSVDSLASSSQHIYVSVSEVTEVPDISGLGLHQLTLPILYPHHLSCAKKKKLRTKSSWCFFPNRSYRLRLSFISKMGDTLQKTSWTRSFTISQRLTFAHYPMLAFQRYKSVNYPESFLHFIRRFAQFSPQYTLQFSFLFLVPDSHTNLRFTVSFPQKENAGSFSATNIASAQTQEFTPVGASKLAPYHCSFHSLTPQARARIYYQKKVCTPTFYAGDLDDSILFVLTPFAPSRRRDIMRHRLLSSTSLGRQISASSSGSEGEAGAKKHKENGEASVGSPRSAGSGSESLTPLKIEFGSGGGWSAPASAEENGYPAQETAGQPGEPICVCLSMQQLFAQAFDQLGRAEAQVPPFTPWVQWDFLAGDGQTRLTLLYEVYDLHRRRNILPPTRKGRGANHRLEDPLELSLENAIAGAQTLEDVERRQELFFPASAQTSKPPFNRCYLRIEPFEIFRQGELRPLSWFWQPFTQVEDWKSAAPQSIVPQSSAPFNLHVEESPRVQTDAASVTGARTSSDGENASDCSDATSVTNSVSFKPQRPVKLVLVDAGGAVVKVLVDTETTDWHKGSEPGVSRGSLHDASSDCCFNWMVHVPFDTSLDRQDFRIVALSRSRFAPSFKPRKEGEEGERASSGQEGTFIGFLSQERYSQEGVLSQEEGKDYKVCGYSAVFTICRALSVKELRFAYATFCRSYNLPKVRLTAEILSRVGIRTRAHLLYSAPNTRCLLPFEDGCLPFRAAQEQRAVILGCYNELGNLEGKLGGEGGGEMEGWTPASVNGETDAGVQQYTAAVEVVTNLQLVKHPDAWRLCAEDRDIVRLLESSKATAADAASETRTDFAGAPIPVAGAKKEILKFYWNNRIPTLTASFDLHSQRARFRLSHLCTQGTFFGTQITFKFLLLLYPFFTSIFLISIVRCVQNHEKGRFAIPVTEVLRSSSTTGRIFTEERGSTAYDHNREHSSTPIPVTQGWFHYCFKSIFQVESPANPITSVLSPVAHALGYLPAAIHHPNAAALAMPLTLALAAVVCIALNLFKELFYDGEFQWRAALQQGRRLWHSCNQEEGTWGQPRRGGSRHPPRLKRFGMSWDLVSADRGVSQDCSPSSRPPSDAAKRPAHRKTPFWTIERMRRERILATVLNLGIESMTLTQLFLSLSVFFWYFVYALCTLERNYVVFVVIGAVLYLLYLVKSDTDAKIALIHRIVHDKFDLLLVRLVERYNRDFDTAKSRSAGSQRTDPHSSPSALDNAGIRPGTRIGGRDADQSAIFQPLITSPAGLACVRGAEYFKAVQAALNAALRTHAWIAWGGKSAPQTQRNRPSADHCRDQRGSVGTRPSFAIKVRDIFDSNVSNDTSPALHPNTQLRPVQLRKERASGQTRGSSFWSLASMKSMKSVRRSTTLGPGQQVPTGSSPTGGEGGLRGIVDNWPAEKVAQLDRRRRLIQGLAKGYRLRVFLFEAPLDLLRWPPPPWLLELLEKGANLPSLAYCSEHSLEIAAQLQSKEVAHKVFACLDFDVQKKIHRVIFVPHESSPGSKGVGVSNDGGRSPAEERVRFTASTAWDRKGSTSSQASSNSEMLSRDDAPCNPRADAAHRWMDGIVLLLPQCPPETLLSQDPAVLIAWLFLLFSSDGKRLRDADLLLWVRRTSLLGPDIFNCSRQNLALLLRAEFDLKVHPVLGLTRKAFCTFYENEAAAGGGRLEQALRAVCPSNDEDYNAFDIRNQTRASRGGLSSHFASKLATRHVRYGSDVESQSLGSLAVSAGDSSQQSFHDRRPRRHDALTRIGLGKQGSSRAALSRSGLSRSGLCRSALSRSGLSRSGVGLAARSDVEGDVPYGTSRPAPSAAGSTVRFRTFDTHSLHTTAHAKHSVALRSHGHPRDDRSPAARSVGARSVGARSVGLRSVGATSVFGRQSIGRSTKLTNTRTAVSRIKGQGRSRSAVAFGRARAGRATSTLLKNDSSGKDKKKKTVQDASITAVKLTAIMRQFCEKRMKPKLLLERNPEALAAHILVVIREHLDPIFPGQNAISDEPRNDTSFLKHNASETSDHHSPSEGRGRNASEDGNEGGRGLAQGSESELSEAGTSAGETSAGEPLPLSARGELRGDRTHKSVHFGTRRRSLLLHSPSDSQHLPTDSPARQARSKSVSVASIVKKSLATKIPDSSDSSFVSLRSNETRAESTWTEEEGNGAQRFSARFVAATVSVHMALRRRLLQKFTEVDGILKDESNIRSQVKNFFSVEIFKQLRRATHAISTRKEYLVRIDDVNSEADAFDFGKQSSPALQLIGGPSQSPEEALKASVASAESRIPVRNARGCPSKSSDENLGGGFRSHDVEEGGIVNVLIRSPQHIESLLPILISSNLLLELNGQSSRRKACVVRAFLLRLGLLHKPLRQDAEDFNESGLEFLESHFQSVTRATFAEELYDFLDTHYTIDQFQGILVTCGCAVETAALREEHLRPISEVFSAVAPKAGSAGFLPHLLVGQAFNAYLQTHVTIAHIDRCLSFVSFSAMSTYSNERLSFAGGSSLTYECGLSNARPADELMWTLPPLSYEEACDSSSTASFKLSHRFFTAKAAEELVIKACLNARSQDTRSLMARGIRLPSSLVSDQSLPMVTFDMFEICARELQLVDDRRTAQSWWMALNRLIAPTSTATVPSESHNDDDFGSLAAEAPEKTGVLEEMEGKEEGLESFIEVRVATLPTISVVEAFCHLLIQPITPEGEYMNWQKPYELPVHVRGALNLEMFTDLLKELRVTLPVSTSARSLWELFARKDLRLQNVVSAHSTETATDGPLSPHRPTSVESDRGKSSSSSWKTRYQGLGPSRQQKQRQRRRQRERQGLEGDDILIIPCRLKDSPVLFETLHEELPQLLMGGLWVEPIQALLDLKDGAWTAVIQSHCEDLHDVVINNGGLVDVQNLHCLIDELEEEQMSLRGFQALLSRVKLSFPLETIELVFNAYDADLNDLITPDEAVQVIRTLIIDFLPFLVAEKLACEYHSRKRLVLRTLVIVCVFAYFIIGACASLVSFNSRQSEATLKAEAQGSGMQSMIGVIGAVVLQLSTAERGYSIFERSVHNAIEETIGISCLEG